MRSILESVKPVKDTSYKKVATPVSEALTPYRLVADLIKISEEFKKADDEYNDSLTRLNNESVELLRPFGQGPRTGHSVLVGQYSKKTAELLKAGGLGDFIRQGFGAITAMDTAKGIAGRLPGSAPTSDKLHEKDIQSLTDPYHELELRNIQSEALLNDLMANDEVIQGHDPEEVVDAYNEVSQLTPFSTSNKAIIRDLIRKRLSGGPQALDQFTVGDVYKTQEILRGIQTPQQGQQSVLRSMGVLPNVGPTH